MQTESIALDELKTPERNVRIHPDAQIAELMRAVEMFGQTRPVVIDEDNTVLAGNGLVAALQRLKIRTADVLRLNGLSPAAKTKLMLSDNKIYTLGHDDYDNIMSLIRDLDVDDLNIPGYDNELLASLIGGDTAAVAALEEFGRMSEEEKAARRAHPVRIMRIGAESEVTCPHCGKTFTIQ